MHLNKIKYGFAILILFLLHSCGKNDFTTNADDRLQSTIDTLKFDTVFTSVGNITKSFKIVNPHSKKINIDNIKLGGGSTSSFKINVNGSAGSSFNNIEIASNDSIYVFVTLLVNPTAANLPFVLQDSVLVQYNSNLLKVQLQAYGQNANFIDNGLVLTNANFTNSKPYVILGGLQVAQNATLTIQAGTKIYCHANAPILIDGTLQANGTATQPIVFAGDRLDVPYSTYPAAWPGIYIRTSAKDNILTYCQINNAYQGLNVNGAAVNANPKLLLQQCIIDNAFDAGLALTNTRVTGQNVLVSNCGKNVEIKYGGSYSFTHCSFVAYSNNYILHKRPVVFASDANDDNLTAPLTANFVNSIFYGDVSFVNNEIEIEKKQAPVAITLQNCLYRAATDPAFTSFTQNIKNIDPSFDSVNTNQRIYDFRVTKNPLAPGINKAAATSLLVDIEGKNRNVGLPDIGAYEKP
jgi:hypothetical protein